MSEQSETRPLEGKSILSIEDDDDFVERLMSMLKDAGATKVTTMFDTQSALSEITQRGGNYDLIVVDVMLAESPEAQEDIRKLNKELDRIRKILRKEKDLREDNEALRTELDNAYDTRALILAQREALIDKEGGLKVVENWVNNTKEKSGLPPALFLTCVGSAEAVKKGRDLLGDNGDWLVKPMDGETIITRATRLIQRRSERS